MSVYDSKEICNIIASGRIEGVNPDISKYDKICDDIADLLRNSESHDRFTNEELSLITDCFIMLKRKATSEEKKKIKCRFSRYEELHFKYQEARLKAHAAVPKVPEPAKIEDVLAAIPEVSETVGTSAGEWVDDLDFDLSKSVILEKHVDDNIV